MPMVGPTDYDSIAERYAAKIDDRPWNALYERPATLALLPDVNGKDVLDAGCGHGWYADRLARRGARIVAVDRSREMVNLARERLGGRARVIQGDVSDLGDTLANDSFDVIRLLSRGSLLAGPEQNLFRMGAPSATEGNSGVFDASSRP